MIHPLAEDCKIIHKNFQEMLQEVPENVSHEPLKCTRGIAEAKWHSIECKGPPICSEGGFQLIILPDKHLVITGKSIKKTETFLTGNMIKNHINER
jgi:hypothetical protein